MARGLIIYSPRVAGAQPQHMPGPALTRPMVDATRTAEGAMVQSMLSSGQGILAVGAREIAEQKRVQLATDVMEAATEYEAEARQFEEQYYSENKGASARDAGTAFAEWHKENGRRYAERFSGNPEASLLFARSARQSAAASVQRGFGYGREQDQVYRADTLAARKADLFQFAASTDDAEAIARRRETFGQEAATLMPGRDTTAYMAEVDREMTINAVNTRLANGDMEGARALLDNPDTAKLLGTSHDEVAGRVRREEDARYLITTSDKLAASYGSDLNGAIGWVRDNESDPVRRQALEQQVRERWSMDEALRLRNERAERASRLDAAYKGVMDAADPKAAGDIIAALPPEERAGMYAVARGRFAGTQVRTDPVRAVQARDRILAGEEFSLEGEYGAQVSARDMADLKALAASDEQKGQASARRAMLDNFWLRAGLPTVGPVAQSAKATAVLEFERRVREEGADTDNKREDILFNMLALGRDRLGLGGGNDARQGAGGGNATGTSGGNARGTGAGQGAGGWDALFSGAGGGGASGGNATGAGGAGVPESARDIIIRRLRDEGIDPTEANIDAVYQRNRNRFQ